MTNSVTLYVPQLLATPRRDNTGTLRDYLAKADQFASTLGPALNFSHFFTPSVPLPAAALLAALSGSFNKSMTYCLVSPVDCYADQHTVYVAKKTTPLSEATETLLLERLNAFLVQDNITLQKIGNGLWLFVMSHHTEVTFHDVHSLIGQSMSTVLPTGNDAVYWRTLLTECQMLLSQYAPTQEGSTTSLWFWGNGRYPDVLQSPFNAIFTNELLLQAMASSAKIQVEALPIRWHSSLLDSANNILIADLRFHQQSAPDIPLFEEQWLTPLLAALKKGTLSSVRLMVGNHIEYCLKRRHLYYFWRTHKGIEFIQ